MENREPISIENYSQLHPADIADRLQRLSPEEAREILTLLPPWVAFAVVAELDHEKSAKLRTRHRRKRI